MNWLDEIENELRRIIPNENPGRTRTIARRAVGIALKQYYNMQSNDVIELLKRASMDESFPNSVRECATKLCTRISSNFISASINPIEDAKRIIDFVSLNINQ